MASKRKWPPKRYSRYATLEAMVERPIYIRSDGANMAREALRGNLHSDYIVRDWTSEDEEDQS